MKKLMIAACAIAMAAVAQAATYSWSSTGTIYTWNSTEAKGWPSLTSGTAYFVFADAYSKDDIVADFQKGTALSSGKLTQSATINADSTITATSATSDYTENKSVYFVVFDDSHMFLSGDQTAAYNKFSASSVVFTSAQVDDVWGDEASNAKDGYTIDGWYEVGKEDPEPTPEPTSGLLMLLGMAGLALRRKQK